MDTYGYKRFDLSRFGGRYFRDYSPGAADGICSLRWQSCDVISLEQRIGCLGSSILTFAGGKEAKMVPNLEALAEAVDLTRIDRKLADMIQSDLTRINAEITEQGFSEVTVDGKTFRVTRTPQVAAKGAA
jgi:hypothetical protein